ncbi:hypothetical protein ABB28_17195, partial [Stenotrophomonas chelatiphaga]
MSRLPSLYISHGSPMTALQPGLVGQRLAELAADLPRPRAIVMASAHWLSAQPLVGAHPLPPTIHDFGGFPDALYQLQYPVSYTHYEPAADSLRSDSGGPCILKKK